MSRMDCSAVMRLTLLSFCVCLVVWSSILVTTSQGAVIGNNSGSLADSKVAPSAKAAKSNFNAIFGIFKEVVARSATTSEVLTLNLTNLLVLLLLKGILIALGVAGGLGFGFLGRSAVSPSKPYFTTDDLRWGATYLLSSQEKDYSCLNALACLDPENANDYVTGCKLMLKGAKVVGGVLPRFFPYNEKYEIICKSVKEAAFYNGDCIKKYPCGVDLYKR